MTAISKQSSKHSANSCNHSKGPGAKSDSEHPLQIYSIFPKQMCTIPAFHHSDIGCCHPTSQRPPRHCSPFTPSSAYGGLRASLHRSPLFDPPVIDIAGGTIKDLGQAGVGLRSPNEPFDCCNQINTVKRHFKKGIDAGIMKLGNKGRLGVT